jgi:hypothetical protein
LSLDYFGNDAEFGTALNNEFSSLQCSIFEYDSADQNGFLSMLSMYNASMTFDGAFMSGETGLLFNQSKFNFNCSGNIQYEVMMEAPAPIVPSNETVVPSNETAPSNETVVVP